MPKNVRLFLQIPPDAAMRVVGRLWASGVMTREQYERNMRQIDSKVLEYEKERNKKLEKLFAQNRQFYKKEVKN